MIGVQFNRITESLTGLLNLHFDVIGSGDLLFYVYSLVACITILKILVIKRSGCFIAMDCDYLF